jgi:hypothetical protein
VHEVSGAHCWGHRIKKSSVNADGPAPRPWVGFPGCSWSVMARRGLSYVKLQTKRTGTFRLPAVRNPAGGLGSDRLAPGFGDALPRPGRPTPSGGALRLPRLRPARRDEQHHAAARPGDHGTPANVGPSHLFGRRRSCGRRLTDPATPNRFERGRGKPVAAASGAGEGFRSEQPLLSRRRAVAWAC